MPAGTTTLRARAAALAVVAIAALGACGDDSGGGGGGGGGDAGAAVPDVDEVAACLEDGGLTASGESNVPPELRERLGIEDSLSLSGEGDLVGLGSITWFVDTGAAEEDHEAGAAVRTDDVARGIRGRVTYDYAGSEEAAALIEACLDGDA